MLSAMALVLSSTATAAGVHVADAWTATAQGQPRLEPMAALAMSWRELW
jgi:hypothetical protein